MAAKLKLKIDQGATFIKPFTWKAAGVPVNMTGYTARMQMREELDADTTIIELTTENGGISIEPLDGMFTLTMSDAQTKAMNFDTAIYDIELIAPDGTVTRILKGSVTLSREVTR